MTNLQTSHTAITGTTPLDKSLGFIGTGEMATAMACCLVGRGIVRPDRLFLRDVYTPSAQRAAERTGGSVLVSAYDIVTKADVVVLAVKPQQIESVLHELTHDQLGKPRTQSADRLFITIAAGIRIETYTKFLGASARVARAMPNTPMLVGEGASAYCGSESLTESDYATVHTLLSATGRAERLSESQLDAVTGLSGSGPAYMFLILDALAAGGVKMGLPRRIALELAAQTMRGAATMVLESGEHPAVLQDRVTTPAGTTIAGLSALERLGVRAAMMTAVEEATMRSHAMGQK
ncbi:MAG: pyrroline-5-carboxylate reductase [Thermoguttaceae bacterium]